MKSELLGSIDHLLITKNNIDRYICVINKMNKYYHKENDEIKLLGLTLLKQIKKELEIHDKILIPIDVNHFKFFDKVSNLATIDPECELCKNYFRCSSLNRK